MNKSPRAYAFESLKKCASSDKYSNLEVLTRLSGTTLDPRDKALYTALFYGVIERQITLDAVLARYSKRPLTDLDGTALVLLRLGAYQILFMDRVPDFSACDETVKLAPRFLKPYINGILRAVAKDKGEMLRFIATSEPSVKYSTPQWIIDIFEKGYGREGAEAILEGFRKAPPLTLRVNTLKTTGEALIEKIKESGREARPHPAVPDIIITSGSPETLPGFEEGEFFVQGTNSRRAVLALGAKAGDLVVDACACPGGKSFSVAIDMRGEGEVYSFDLHENKLSLIEKGAKRLGVDIITASKRDARQPDERLMGRADLVICDVPCSGLGIIGKKPDIKYKAVSDIERLPEIQRDILSASARYLKKGGRLLYSTCTLNPLENECITNAFLEENPNFHREGNPTTAFPSDLWEDGFFYDILIKDE